MPWSQAAPASSARTSSTPCSRGGTRSSSSTTSARASARTSPRARGSSSSNILDPALAERVRAMSGRRCASTSRPRPTCRPRCGGPTFDAEVNVVGTIRVLEAAGAARARRLQLDRRRDLRRVRPARSRGRPAQAALARTASPSSRPRSTSPRGTGCTGRGTERSASRNVYGPRQEAGLEGGVVAIFLNAMAAGRETTIYGDGGQTRDFVHVDDVVRALLLGRRARRRVQRRQRRRDDDPGAARALPRGQR